MTTDLQDIEEQLDREKTALQRATGQREAVLEQMKELGVSSAKQARIKLRKEERRFAKVRRQLDEAMTELKELLDGLPT